MDVVNKQPEVFYTEKPDSKFVNLEFFYNVGSMEEVDNTRGLAHFVEHMIFNGCPDYNKEELVNVFTLAGGTINAYTTKEETCYQFKFLKESLKEVLPLIYLMLNKPNFHDADIDKEKEIIIQELFQMESNFWNKTYNTVFECFSNTNYRHPVIGYENTIKNIVPQDLKDFHSNFYIKENLHVDVIGYFTVEEMNSLVAFCNTFNSNKDFEGVLREPVKSCYPSPKIKYVAGLTQTRIAYAKVYEDTSIKARLVYEIVSKIFSGDMNSRFFKKFREEDRLCYEVFSLTSDVLGKIGIFSGISLLDNSKVQYVLEEFEKNYLSCKDDITEDELIKAKILITAGLLLTEESFVAKSRYFSGNYRLYGDLVSIPDIISELKKITLKDIYDVLSSDTSNIVATGILIPESSVVGNGGDTDAK